MQPHEFRQKRVLIIDDDPMILMLLETALRSALQVIIAEGPEQGLQRARLLPQPDLILLDVSMPVMSGHEVCRRLKADPRTRSIPVIFTTALGMDEDEAVGFGLGAADYITKPFRLPVVLARVRAHLETQHLTRQIRQHNEQLDQKVRERTIALEEEVRNRRLAEERVIHHACHDPLTALPNQVLLRSRMEALSAGGAEHRFALLTIALSGFHEINNTVGHQNGSQILHQVAGRLQSLAARMTSALPVESAGDRVSFLARMDGVSFGMLVREPDSDAELIAVARTLLDNFDECFDVLEMSLNIGASIGIARSPQHGIDADTLLRHAQIALEEAAQRDERVAVYAESIDRYSARRLTLMGELRSALQQEGLQLAFQPQLDMSAGRIVSAEALIRWQHPKLGFVRPDEFIPMAEQTGIIKPVTSWVLRTALQSCQAFAERGIDLGVSVNLSARNLVESDLLAQVLALCDRYEVSTQALVLEVTETMVMQNPDVAMRALGRFQAEGIRISIDDFGTGYSSLGYLKRLPVSEVKIDRSFVMDMLKDKDDRVIVQTIIDMGHNLGLRVVAEGVEDQATLEALGEMGCDLIQGYHIARPQFHDQLLAWVATSAYPVLGRVPA